MTVPSLTAVRIADGLIETVVKLRQESEDALARSEKLPPGDLSELRRYEALQVAIERCALASIWAGGLHHTGPDAGEAAAAWGEDGVVVTLHLPHGPGATATGGIPGTGPLPPLPIWRSGSDRAGRAMAERFRQQVVAALSGNSEAAMLRPSGITNSVVTETLREFAGRSDGETSVFIPVRYRDGSFGPDFPLRATAMTASAPSGWRHLRFTLLSIRHVEMDALVDGAWLRNSMVSRPRLAGETDVLVHQISQRQLTALTESGPVMIDLYQTGLEPAVVGFYRAVLGQLAERPDRLAVRPFYFRGRGRFDEGTIWAAA